MMLTPHGHPTADEQAFPQDLADPSLAEQPRDDVAEQQRKRQERDADHEAGASASEQLPEPSPRHLGTLGEEFPDRVGRNLASPPDDERLGIRVEIALTKW
jgi:hypothetical protein